MEIYLVAAASSFGMQGLAAIIIPTFPDSVSWYFVQCQPGVSHHCPVGLRATQQLYRTTGCLLKRTRDSNFSAAYNKGLCEPPSICIISECIQQVQHLYKPAGKGVGVVGGVLRLPLALKRYLEFLLVCCGHAIHVNM